MNEQDTAIDQAFEFTYWAGNHENDAGWYAFEGGNFDEDTRRGPWESQFEARQAMRMVFFV